MSASQIHDGGLRRWVATGVFSGNQLRTGQWKHDHQNETSMVVCSISILVAVYGFPARYTAADGGGVVIGGGGWPEVGERERDGGCHVKENPETLFYGYVFIPRARMSNQLRF